MISGPLGESVGEGVSVAEGVAEAVDEGWMVSVGVRLGEGEGSISMT